MVHWQADVALLRQHAQHGARDVRSVPLRMRSRHVGVLAPLPDPSPVVVGSSSSSSISAAVDGSLILHIQTQAPKLQRWRSTTSPQTACTSSAPALEGADVKPPGLRQ